MREESRDQIFADNRILKYIIDSPSGQNTLYAHQRPYSDRVTYNLLLTEWLIPEAQKIYEKANQIGDVAAALAKTLNNRARSKIPYKNGISVSKRAATQLIRAREGHPIAVNFVARSIIEHEIPTGLLSVFVNLKGEKEIIWTGDPIKRMVAVREELTEFDTQRREPSSGAIATVLDREFGVAKSGLPSTESGIEKQLKIYDMLTHVDELDNWRENFGEAFRRARLASKFTDTQQLANQIIWGKPGHTQKLADLFSRIEMGDSDVSPHVIVGIIDRPLIMQALGNPPSFKQFRAIAVKEMDSAGNPIPDISMQSRPMSTIRSNIPEYRS